MKALRALLLVLTLSVCAYAGEMDNGRAGEMPNGKAGEMPCGKASLSTQIALQVLQSVLPLF